MGAGTPKGTVREIKWEEVASDIRGLGRVLQCERRFGLKRNQKSPSLEGSAYI